MILATDRGNASIYSTLHQKRVGSFCYENGLDSQNLNPDYQFTCMDIMSEGRMAVFGSTGGSLTFSYYPDMK